MNNCRPAIEVALRPAQSGKRAVHLISTSSPGIARAVDGRVLIYIHKEEALDDVERRFPATHYVLIDDKQIGRAHV